MLLYLNKAIYDILTEDPELVGWLGHTSSNNKIYSSFPEKILSMPAIAFWDETTIRQDASLDEFKTSQFNIGFFVGVNDSKTYNGWTLKGKTLLIRLLDRVDDLFSPGNGADLDISNSQVQTESVRMVGRLPIRFENDADYYRGDLTLQINWYTK